MNVAVVSSSLTVGGWSATGAHVTEKVDSIDDFHREKPCTLIFDQFVQGRQIAMDYVRQGAKFLFEKVERTGVDARQRLEGEAHLAFAIERFVHDPHSAGAAETIHNLESWRALEGQNAHARRLLQLISPHSSCYPGAAARPNSSNR